MVAHHSIVETYAVLTRLPGELRLTGPETKQLLDATIKPNMKVAEFHSSSIWDCIESLVNHSAVGGRSYDSFIAEILKKSGVAAIATFNTTHFNEFASELNIIDPSKPEGK